MSADCGRLGELITDRYEVRAVPYVPDAPVVAFPCFGKLPTTSVILRVQPRDTAAWYAEVRSNGSGEGRFWETRDPNWFCALFGKALYWIDARDPRSVVAYETSVLGGERCIFVRSHDMLVVLGWGGQIDAYGREGPCWQTVYLGFDELLEVAVDGDVIRGVGIDCSSSALPFAVDLATGARVGGLSGF